MHTLVLVAFLVVIGGCGLRLSDFLPDDDDAPPPSPTATVTEPPVVDTPRPPPTRAPTRAPTPAVTPPHGEIEERRAPDGAGNFLWKPQADNTPRNLVVLLPSSFNDVTIAVELHRALPPTAETRIEGGRYTGIANGNRGHWRYSRPGAAYGRNVVVLAIRRDGSRAAWRIADGSQRVD